MAELPPPGSWDEFEEIVWDLLTNEWNDPNTVRHGRQGQAQQGVDIYGRRAGQGAYIGAQCKVHSGSSRLTYQEILDEVEKAEAFEPSLGEFLVATTAKRDAGVQQAVRLLSAERAGASNFLVYIWFWEDIQSRLTAHTELVEKHYPQFFPSPRAVTAATRYQLPSPLSSFIGRELFVQRGVQYFEDETVRVLTLVGTGGVGKTRLALEIGRRVENAFDGGAICVDLSSYSDPELLPSAILHALAVPENGRETPFEQLQTFLKETQMLLLLDNFDSVIDAAPIVGNLLATSPQVRVLVTSRLPLSIDGEHEFPVEPMDLPDLAPQQPLETLEKNEAVALFLDRARAIRPPFEVDRESARIIAEVCIRLDGLPLAIEIAASRTRTISLLSLLSQLDKRLPSLVNSRRNAPPRHRTLRAAIGWSYDLLNENERAWFRRLSVFAGGCTSEAADAVVRAVGVSGEASLDKLGPLVQANLLRAVPGSNGEPRFAMLETIREYAMECLEHVEEATATFREFARYYSDYAKSLAERYSGNPNASWMEALEAEHDNLRAALQWCVEHDEFQAGAGIIRWIWRFWNARGYISEGRGWIEEALIHSEDLDGIVRTDLLAGAAQLARRQQDYQRGKQCLDLLVREFEQQGNRKMLAETLLEVASLEHSQEKIREAVDTFEAAESHFDSIGDRVGVARARTGLGTIAVDLQQTERAHELLDEECELLEELGSSGDETALMSCLQDRARLAQAEQNWLLAMSFIEKSLQLQRKTGDTRGVPHGLLTLARLVQLGNDTERARHLRMESQLLSYQAGDRLGMAEAMLERARFDEPIDTPLRLELIRNAIPIIITANAQVLLAESIEVVAKLNVLSDSVLATELYSGTYAWREQASRPLWPSDRVAQESKVRTLRAILGSEAYERAWNAGQCRSLLELAAHILKS